MGSLKASRTLCARASSGDSAELQILIQWVWGEAYELAFLTSSWGTRMLGTVL